MAEKDKPKQPPKPPADPKSLFVPLPSKKVTGSRDSGSGGNRRKGRSRDQ